MKEETAKQVVAWSRQIEEARHHMDATHRMIEIMEKATSPCFIRFETYLPENAGIYFDTTDPRIMREVVRLLRMVGAKHGDRLLAAKRNLDSIETVGVEFVA